MPREAQLGVGRAHNSEEGPAVIQIATMQEEVRHHLHAPSQTRMLPSPEMISLTQLSPLFTHPFLGLTIFRGSSS